MPGIQDQEYQSFLDTLSSDEKASLKPFLETYISDGKREQMEQVLRHRTRHVAVVLENVYQAHNAAAALRSCECFGFQDLHVIELSHDYAINPDVTMGGCKWVSLIHHRKNEGGTADILQKMKRDGYRIAATSLRPGCIPLDELGLDEPLALCFGTEETGLSDEAHQQADVFVQIPSYGFTRSFNVSVSVALSLSSVRNRLEAGDIKWRLNPSEAEDLHLIWMMKTANRGLVLARYFLATES